MFLLLELLFFVVLFGVYWYRNDRKRYEKYPPGPPRLPLIGNIHQIMKMSDFPATAFQRLGDMYGDILFLKIGMNDAVIFNTRDSIHEMLLHDKTNNRARFGFVKDRDYNKNLGIIWGNGSSWQNLRRFTMRNLRDVGFGKTDKLNEVVNEEVEKFTQHLKQQVSQSPNSILELQDPFNLTVVNVLWRLVSGKAYDYDDPKILRLLQLNSDFFRSANFGLDIAEAYPFLRDWFPNWTGRTLQMDACQALYDYGKELLEEQRKEIRKGSQGPPSFIEVFSKKVEDSKDDPDTDFTEENFVMTILDLLIAGSETSSNTLSFGLLFSMLNPEVQEKVQKEIDEVIPPGTPIDSTMKSKLPYTTATVLEVYRYSTVIPNPAPREAAEDFYFHGHLIKKGMCLIYNLHAAHFSEKAWGDPLNFRPERFLNPSGTGIDEKMLNKMEIFGAGRRFCVGQSVADAAIFIYFASVLRKFKFVKVPGTNPTTKPILGITTVPHPFQVQIIERKPA